MLNVMEPSRRRGARETLAETVAAGGERRTPNTPDVMPGAGSQGLTGTSRLPVQPASWTLLDEPLLPCSKSVPTVSLTPFYPRGNPLTESMPFIDGDGVCWLAYIEGVPPAPRSRLGSQTVLPGRRLRFDSVTESRVTARVPAGSPFLADARLQSLLDEARPVPPMASATSSRSGGSSILEHPVIEWATRAGELGRAVVADWSQRWRRSANRRQILHGRVRELVSGASNALHVVVVAVLGRRGARR